MEEREDMDTVIQSISLLVIHSVIHSREYVMYRRATYLCMYTDEENKCEDEDKDEHENVYRHLRGISNPIEL